MEKKLIENEHLAFKVFHIGFVLVILVASIETALTAMESSNSPLLILASAETVAVVLFMSPRLIKFAGIALLAIFSIAVTFALISGVILSNLHLIVYWVCTYFIMVYKSNRPFCM